MEHLFKKNTPNPTKNKTKKTALVKTKFKKYIIP